MGAPPISLMGDQLVHALAHSANAAGDDASANGAVDQPGRAYAPRHAANDAEPIA
jgi:hypothetical protein